MNVEEFLVYLKKQYPFTEFPDKITRENINTCKKTLVDFMEFALWKKNLHITLLAQLIEMGGDVSSHHLAISQGDNRLYILQNCDTKSFSIETLIIHGWSLDELYTAIEYGISLPEKWTSLNPNAANTKCLQDWFNCITSRISNSRKALAALIICCKQRTHQGTLVFGAVRDVLFVVAREMWGARSPARTSCGARSVLWGFPEKKLKLKK